MKIIQKITIYVLFAMCLVVLVWAIMILYGTITNNGSVSFDHYFNGKSTYMPKLNGNNYTWSEVINH